MRMLSQSEEKSDPPSLPRPDVFSRGLAVVADTNVISLQGQRLSIETGFFLSEVKCLPPRM